MDANTTKMITDTVQQIASHDRNFWDYLSNYGISGLILLFSYLNQRQYQKHIDSLQTHYEQLMGKVLEISTNFVKGQEAQENIMNKNLEILNFLKNRIK